jgi:hypothetical protein
MGYKGLWVERKIQKDFFLIFNFITVAFRSILISCDV